MAFEKVSNGTINSLYTQNMFLTRDYRGPYNPAEITKKNSPERE